MRAWETNTKQPNFMKERGDPRKGFGAEHPSVGYDFEAASLALCRAGEYDEAVRPFLTALRFAERLSSHASSKSQR